MGNKHSGTESPCKRECKLGGDICTGCYRSIGEIKNWNKLSNDEKIEINKRLIKN